MDLKKKMKAFFTLKRRANDGFTLVELIVVIAILAILAGVAIPAYSGYVAKAEAAADEQLLAAVNTAFVSACLANGESNIDRTDVVMLGVDANGKVLNVGSSDKINGSFAIYFAGNEDAAFKVNKSYRYNGTEGIFEKTAGNVVVGKYTYGGKDYTLVITEDDQLLYLDSDFYEMGTGYLLDQMDNVVKYAAGRFQQFGGDGLSNLRDDEDFLAFCNQYPEYATADKPTKTKIEMLALTQYTALKAQDRTTEELYSIVLNNPGTPVMGDDGLDFVANATMYSLGMTFAESDEGLEAIQNLNLNGESFDKTNADHIIKLMQYTPAGVDEWGNPVENDPNAKNAFSSWLEDNEENAKSNIEGFKGTMGMLNDNQENLDLNMLFNGGYGNDDLSAALEAMLKGN